MVYEPSESELLWLSVDWALADREGLAGGSIAENGRPDPDHGRTLLDRDLEVVAHAHGQFGEPGALEAVSDEILAESLHCGEIGSRCFRVVAGRGKHHQAFQTDRAHRPGRLQDVPKMVRREAVF